MNSDSHTKVKKYLFADNHECAGVLSSREMGLKQRAMLCVTKLMDKPTTPDSEIVEYLMGGCDGTCACVGRSQAYRDLAFIRSIVGNIQLASKAWLRYTIQQGALSVYKSAYEGNDYRSAAAALNVLGRYTRCDKEDDSMDWSEMLPPSFEPSDDITLVEGLEPIPVQELESRRKKLRSLFKEKLSKEAEPAEEVKDV